MTPDDDHHAHELTNLSIRWFTKHRQAIVARAFPVVPVEIDLVWALREAIDRLTRTAGSGYVSAHAGLGLDVGRVQIAFDGLAEYVVGLKARLADQVAKTTTWKRIAIVGWIVAVLNLGVVIWVRWFR